jgi:hypothetical protein
MKEILGIGVPHTKKDSLEEDLNLRLTKDQTCFQEGRRRVQGKHVLKEKLRHTSLTQVPGARRASLTTAAPMLVAQDQPRGGLPALVPATALMKPQSRAPDTG